MNSKYFFEIADLLMRRRRIWVPLIFTLVAAGFFYISVVKDKVDLQTVIVEPTYEPLYVSFTEVFDSTEVDNDCPSGNLVYGNCCVISLNSDTERNSIHSGLVTLCTQGTLDFLHHVLILCSRWNGPLSVAVYTPPEDYVDARNLVDRLRKCDFCVRHWVSWHFFFRKQQMPDVSYKPLMDCNSITSPKNRTTKRRFEGPYPINIGRNIARNNTSTPYIFSIDIELYPSFGVLAKFERMMRSYTLPNDRPQVWVLPVFEVHSKYRTPINKFQLKKMFDLKQAISFHKFRCNECHKIPNLTQWMDQDSQLKSEAKESVEELRVWMTVQRNRKFRLHFWEPFFIGTRDDPEFHPHLSWEGKQNKMQVAYEMCLRNYDFHIVENAFLVHSPGINVYNATKEKFRLKYQYENDKWMKTIKKELTKKYNATKGC